MCALFPRRLRAAALAIPICLAGCDDFAAVVRPDPHVVMADGRLDTAARACAARGFAYVSRTGPRSAFCLAVNSDNEPEAVPVASLMAQP
jgi:hypothetical protein